MLLLKFQIEIVGGGGVLNESLFCRSVVYLYSICVRACALNAAKIKICFNSGFTSIRLNVYAYANRGVFQIFSLLDDVHRELFETNLLNTHNTRCGVEVRCSKLQHEALCKDVFFEGKIIEYNASARYLN